MAAAVSPALKELRILLCQKSAASRGAREWIEKSYISMKKANPKLPILVRECSGTPPQVFARYGQGREVSKDLTNKGAQEVKQIIDTLAKAQ